LGQKPEDGVRAILLRSESVPSLYTLEYIKNSANIDLTKGTYMPLYLYCVIILINMFGLKFAKQRDIRTNRQKMIQQIFICREDSNALLLLYD
jgi:hypothetical protein